MEFSEAFDRLIAHEGCYSDNPADSGNWTGGEVGLGMLKGTKYGISAAAFPTVDIRMLTLDEAKEVYAEHYWNKLGLNRLPPAICFDMFDTAVNSGISTAAKLLQKAVGVEVDGDIGPNTIKAAGLMEGNLLDKRFNGYRLQHLCACKSWPTYGKGWVARVAKNLIED